MSVVRVAKAVVLLALLLSALPLHSQLTVYQNAADSEGLAAQESVEYGDEVNLVGSARIVTKIRFEYSGDFTPQGDEKAILRIYANNGPFWKGNTDYPMPGTLLWESGFFKVNPGIMVAELPVPSIRVQDRFTWTVEFSGLTMQTNDFAGLDFYGNAEIGYSFNDFWERLTTLGWTPVRVGSVAHNNFGVSVTALTEAVLPKLTMVPYRTNYVLASWPRAASDYKLQYKTKVDGNWFNVSGASTVVGDFYNRVFDRSLGTAFFRLMQVAPTTPTLSITNDGSLLHINWPATSTGYVLQSKTSPGSAFWTDEYTPAVPSTTNRFEVLKRATATEQIFRLREETKAASMEILPQGTNLLIRWPATAKGYALQSKPAFDAQFWTLEARPTNAVGSYFQVLVPISADNRIFRLGQ